jgi:hypothetical protein
LWLNERPRILSDLTWGNLAFWHLAPERKVAMDWRHAAVYEPAWVDAFLTVGTEGDLAAVLGEQGAEVMILPTG